MSTHVLFIASLDYRERYRFVMEPMLTTSLDVDCYRDSGNMLGSIFSAVAFLLKRKRFDVVVLTGGDIRNLVWFFLIRLITNARIVIRFGGDPSSVRRSTQASVKASGNRLLYYRGALGFRATCFMLKRVDGVIAVSRHLVESIRPLAGSLTRFCVSPPIVECNVVVTDQPDHDQNLFRLCTVTNLNYREKLDGVIFTIKALIECCQAPERQRNIIFEVVGGGRYLDSLTREIENTPVPENLTIVVHGFQQDVAEFYARADVFTYNSTLDSYPLVLVEATAYGLPIVLNDWGPFSELYENEVSALIYETGNIESLVSAFSRLLDDPALLGIIGQRSRRQYERNTIEARGIELESFVRELS